jgi:SAM-dependent methyltransferase
MWWLPLVLLLIGCAQVFGIVVSDVSQLEVYNVSRVAYPHSAADVQSLIFYAAKHGMSVSVRGCAHSMGGHSVAPNNGLQINMKHMNRLVSLNIIDRLATVEAGMTWAELIRTVNLYGLSPLTLQSYSSFSIGGSISVNAHGITNDHVVGHSIHSLRMVLSDGSLVNCSPTERRELFALVIGGYGLFGVIVDVTVRLTINERYRMVSTFHSVADFLHVYKRSWANTGVKIARLRLWPKNENDTIHLIRFIRPTVRYCPTNQFKNQNVFPRIQTGAGVGVVSRLNDDAGEMSWASRMAYKWVAPLSWFQRLRFWLEFNYKSALDWNNVNTERNELLHESAHSLSHLDSGVIDLRQTHILQEFFVPTNRFGQWLDELRELLFVIKNNGSRLTLLNATIRFVLADTLSFLAYARQDMFAVVFYYRVSIDGPQTELQHIHRQLTNLTLRLNGSFYLPYLHHYDLDELRQAYPQFDQFVHLQRRYDIHRRFSNIWFDTYGPKSISISNDFVPTQLVKPVDECVVLHDFNGTNRVRLLWSMVQSENGCVVKRELELFFRYVFTLVPGRSNVDERIEWFLTEGGKLSDSDFYREMQTYAKQQLGGWINRLWQSFRALTRQRQEIAAETIRLLSTTSVSGLLSLGDGGRYVSAIDHLVTGPIYIIHDRKPSIVEQYWSLTRKVFTDYEVDYDRAEIVADRLSIIPDRSVSVATCYIGLHHFSQPVIDVLLTNLQRIVRPGGYFILREHNATPRNLPLLHAVHFFFNAFTGVSWQEEITEIRNFQPLNCWRELLEKYGFIDTLVSERQTHDPSDNILLSFVHN